MLASCSIERVVVSITSNVQHSAIVQPRNVVVDTAGNLADEGDRLVSGNVFLAEECDTWWVCEGGSSKHKIMT